MLNLFCKTMFPNRKTAFFSLPITALAFFLWQCGAERQKSIDQKKEICRNQGLVAYNASLVDRPAGSGLTLQYSCSATSGFSPSCIETFSSSRVDDNCPIGYIKSTRARCSTQNLIGVCRFSPPNTTEQVVTVVFTLPGDSFEQAVTFCSAPDRNGVFTTTYLGPTESQTNTNAVIVNYLLCVQQAERN